MDANFQVFLDYLFHSYIRDRLHRPRRQLHYWDEWTYWQRALRKGAYLSSYIQAVTENTDDIYETFQQEGLRSTVSGVHNALGHANYLAEETGFLDAFDSHYDRIVAGLTPADFSEHDIRVLESLGSGNARRDLSGLLHTLQTQDVAPSQLTNRGPISMRLRAVEEDLKEGEQSLSNQDDQQGTTLPRVNVTRKSRRWFKGLGQVAQGTALTLADIGLAMGAITFPVSPEAQSWGAFVSTTSGVGMILTGAGDLRGE